MTCCSLSPSLQSFTTTKSVLLDLHVDLSRVQVTHLQGYTHIIMNQFYNTVIFLPNLIIAAMEEDFTVSLSSTSNYRAAETFTKRVYRGNTEHLVKWVHLDDIDKNTSLKGLCKEYTVWMREEEMAACCPTLLKTEVNHPPRGETRNTEGMYAEEYLYTISCIG